MLFTNERFWNISADAKMLYGILLDRMSLSAKNGWIDKNGRVYIIFTIDEAKMALNCAEQKARLAVPRVPRITQDCVHHPFSLPYRMDFFHPSPQAFPGGAPAEEAMGWVGAAPAQV